MMSRRPSLCDGEGIPFFHPDITTPEQVVQIMEERGDEEGIFLVRRSFSKPSNLTISLKHEKGLFHMKIDKTADGKFQLSKGFAFSSIQQLLTYFATNPILNVEKLNGVYLLKGIVCPKNRKQLFKQSKSLGWELGDEQRISNGSNSSNSSNNSNFSKSSNNSNNSTNNSNISNNSNYVMTSSNTNKNRNNNNSNDNDDTDNPYIHPFVSLKSLDIDDGFEDDNYISSKEFYENSKSPEVVELPEGWEGVVRAGRVSYREGPGGKMVSQLPYHVFTQLSSVQFEKLKIFFGKTSPLSKSPATTPRLTNSPLSSSTKSQNTTATNKSNTPNNNQDNDAPNNNQANNVPISLSNNTHVNKPPSDSSQQKSPSNDPLTPPSNDPLTPPSDSRYIMRGGSLYARMDGVRGS